jgi:hypothetical protein
MQKKTEEPSTRVAEIARGRTEAVFLDDRIDDMGDDPGTVQITGLASSARHSRCPSRPEKKSLRSGMGKGIQSGAKIRGGGLGKTGQDPCFFFIVGGHTLPF